MTDREPGSVSKGFDLVARVAELEEVVETTRLMVKVMGQRLEVVEKTVEMLRQGLTPWNVPHD